MEFDPDVPIDWVPQNTPPFVLETPQWTPSPDPDFLFLE